MITVSKTQTELSIPRVSRQVHDLLDEYLCLWRSFDPGRLPSGPVYSLFAKYSHEFRVSRLLDTFIAESRRSPDDRRLTGDVLIDRSLRVLEQVLRLPSGRTEIIRSLGLLALQQQFAAEARRFDASLTDEDIYQAARNVLTMGLIQALLGLPVRLTGPVFAFSLIYPYSDNYLDDPSVPPEVKFSFNHRFYRRILGEVVAPRNPREAMIYRLVSMIEADYPRAVFPQVYESLTAIFEAQDQSLQQTGQADGLLPEDVVRISFEKGGATVLADGYLVAGDLSDSQAEFMFGYGAFTQLMDDLEDVESDLSAGSLTLFSQRAACGPLDELTNCTFQLGEFVFNLMDHFPVECAAPLKQMVFRAVDPLLIISAGTVGRYYTPTYLRRLEAFLPIRFGFLRNQKNKLDRNRMSTTALIKTIAWGL